MIEMTDERAAEVLAAHNEWRRYDGFPGEPGAPVMGDVKELGHAIDHAVSRLRSQPPAEAQPVAWTVLQIGATGSAYDAPDTRRAFTYGQQPGNVLASKLGGAANAAAAASAGDSIDRGLSLLKALQESGFGVFQLEPSSTVAPPSAPVGVEDWLIGDLMEAEEGGHTEHTPAELCGLSAKALKSLIAQQPASANKPAG